MQFRTTHFVISTLSNDQRQAIADFGTPLPVVDPETNQTYVLVEVEVAADPQGGFSACVPGIDAFGGGDTQEDATLAFAVILGKVLESS